ncbi:peptidase inhibitor family I36 protein [Catellatospora aurea]|uniref:Peptidase inhibitor family I36 protein n=1 Tax=Catellatospora aurea TaxID=1337874 RepID=A0ABW2GYV8_9ACTN
MAIIGKRGRVRLASAVLAVAGSVGLVVTTAAPASAAPAYIHLYAAQDVGSSDNGYCDTGYFCAYTKPWLDQYGIGFYNDKWDWAATDVPKIWGGTESINNNAESWWNHGTPSYNNDVQVYQYAGGSGVSMCVQNGVQIGMASSYGMANLPSAHVWRSAC